jgi:hypothetical protein
MPGRWQTVVGRSGAPSLAVGEHLDVVDATPRQHPRASRPASACAITKASVILRGIRHPQQAGDIGFV